jgi:hypothetical protein
VNREVLSKILRLQDSGKPSDGVEILNNIGYVLEKADLSYEAEAVVRSEQAREYAVSCLGRYELQQRALELKASYQAELLSSRGDVALGAETGVGVAFALAVFAPEADLVPLLFAGAGIGGAVGEAFESRTEAINAARVLNAQAERRHTREKLKEAARMSAIMQESMGIAPGLSEIHAMSEDLYGLKDEDIAEVIATGVRARDFCRGDSLTNYSGLLAYVNRAAANLAR